MNSRQILSGIALTAMLAAAAAGQGVPFTAGNLVVLQVGPDGNPNNLSNAAWAAFVKELTLSGTVVQTIALPTLATVSGNRAVTISGTATSEGALTRSVDGRFLTCVGYNADVGTPSIVGTQVGTTNRVVCRIDAQGDADSSTVLNNAFNANNIRSAVTVDGTAFWASGAGNASGGDGSSLHYVLFGSSGASTPVTTSIGTARVVNIFNNQLYLSSSSMTFQGVSTVGSGLPTGSGEIATILPGFPTSSGPSNYDFWFADTATLYVADDRAPGSGGGIQKWTFDGTTWTQAYVMINGLTAGCRGLTGRTVSGLTTLYAVTGDAITPFGGNKLVTVTDTGFDAPYTTIASSPGSTAWRGVDFAPSAGGPAVCYPNCDNSTTAPVLNVQDFSCFLNAFANGASYANCDSSTTAPVLNVQDFSCFLNAFAAGCP